MALAATVETLESVDENLRGEYVEMAEGGFKLDVTESDGYTLENTSGLRSALSKERTSVKSLTTDLKKIERQYDGVDLDELQSFQSKYETTNNKLTKVTEKYDTLAALDPEGEADKLAKAKADKTIKAKKLEWQTQFDDEVTKHSSALSAATDKSTILEKQLHKVLVKSTAIEALTKEGVGDYLDLMLTPLLDQMKYEVTEEGFNVFISDAEGNARVKSDGTDMVASDAVEELKIKYPAQFTSKAKSGGGKDTNSGGSGTPKGEPKSALSKIADGLKDLHKQ